MSFLENFTKQKLFGYFLILWGGNFFFGAIRDFVYISYGYWKAGYVGVTIIDDLIYIAIAAILVLLGTRSAWESS